MIDFTSSNTQLMLERSMQFGWTKQSALLDNIVNADTPGYKAKYTTFEEALRTSLRMANIGETPTASMRMAIASSAPVVREADDETFRMDGNGVDVSEQSIEMVRTSFQLQHVYRALNSDITRLLTAIRGQ
ncbi:MAG: flagellar biosynthesis protein FlgB [Oscillospiraceae bacterium]|nr:flagellar biosynthesis protein FlgB [Oscillospiraceae bacterium]